MKHSSGRLLFAALVGWYLLIPPYGSAQSPYSRWYNHSVFDSASDCFSHRNILVRFQMEESKKGNVFKAISASFGKVPYDAMRAECVSTDDPRLKE
jgi:hypothetical protein